MSRRLSPLDLAFFVLETAERPFNVGPLIVLKPPGRLSGALFADRLLERMLKRPVGAPFNLRLSSPSLTALPQLVSDPDFDLARHVHRMTLRKPGSLKTLLARVCELHPQRMDRARPLWDFYVIDGVQGDRVALYARMHHGVVDGAGFVKIIAQWLSQSPKERVVRAMWEGIASAGDAKRQPVSLTRKLSMLFGEGAGTARTALSLAPLLWRQGLNTLGLGSGSPLPFVTTPGVLKTRPSAHRSLAFCTLPLPELKALGKTRDATINDMLLAVLDIALRRYLDHQGIEPEAPLIADMPVALGGGEGNRIALVQVPLGTPGLAPVERLQAIQSRTKAIKSQMRRGSNDAAVLHSILVHAIPGVWESLGLHGAPLLANLVVSNPFGFADKRYLMGAEIDFVLPVSVIAPGQVLNITATNYVDQFQIAFIAIAEAVPDIERLARYTEEAYETLAASLGT